MQAMRIGACPRFETLSRDGLRAQEGLGSKVQEGVGSKPRNIMRSFGLS